MNVNVKENGGLLRISFNDRVGNHCVLQAFQSTASDEAVIRLGVLSNFDGEDSTPMSLTREELLLLMPFLEHFCKTGHLPFDFLKDAHR